jgi:hypothetical protein
MGSTAVRLLSIIFERITMLVKYLRYVASEDILFGRIRGKEFTSLAIYCKSTGKRI